jgi:hypothetical protein
MTTKMSDLLKSLPAPDRSSFPDTLELRCPTCARKLMDAEFHLSATIVHRRKCRGCGHRYSVVIKPAAIFGGHGYAHTLDFTPIAAA